MTLFDLCKKIALADESLIPEVNKAALTRAGEMIANAVQLVTNDSFVQTLESVGAIIEKLLLDNRADQEKQEITDCIDNIKRWGGYGWSFSPFVNVIKFYQDVHSQNEADDIMRRFCSNDNILEIRNELKQFSLNYRALDEAFNCYQNKQYLACSHLLFSLVDQFFIKKEYRKQKEDGSLGSIIIGITAIKEYEKELKQLPIKDDELSFLCILNILKALQVFYGGSQDFKEEPALINRNYVCHGMYNKEITELDCFRLWSVLYSLIALIPTIIMDPTE